MCRLFALYANKPVIADFSLLKSEKSLAIQSMVHDDGWGVAYFKNGRPVVKKEAIPAYESDKFAGLAVSATSKIFVAHVRLASCGAVAQRNSHPFTYAGRWVFAHNGTLDEQMLSEALEPEFMEDLESDGIDSELYFRLIMQNYHRTGDMVEAIRQTVKTVYEDFSETDSGNFIMSDGKVLYAFRSPYGRKLHYLYRNPKDLASLPFEIMSEETKLLIRSKMLNDEKAFLVASEKLTKDENWTLLKENSLVVVSEGPKYELVEL